MIKKLASHLGEYRRAAILTPMFSALEAVMDILLPTIMAFIIDLGIEKGDMNAIVKYGLLTFAVAAIALLLGILAGKYAAEASTGFAGNLRDAMYENIQHYSFSNIDKFSTAGLVTRMTTDVTNLQNAFQMMERMCVRAPVHLVLSLIHILFFIWAYFFRMRATTSVPPEDAPTLKSRADAMAGRAMAKTRSSMGWSDRGPLRGTYFSKRASSAVMTTVAQPVLMTCLLYTSRCV